MRRCSVLLCRIMDPNIDRNAKLDALADQVNGIAVMFGKVLEMYMANLNANDDYSEKPVHFPKKEPTPDLKNEQDTYDDLGLEFALAR